MGDQFYLQNVWTTFLFVYNPQSRDSDSHLIIFSLTYEANVTLVRFRKTNKTVNCYRSLTKVAKYQKIAKP